MSFVLSMAVDFGKRTLLGENIDSALQQAGIACEKGVLGEAGRWTDLTQRALDDCNAMGKSCVKVAFFGTLLTCTLPFLFGTLTSLAAFSSLTFCVMTHDVGELIKRFAEIDSGEGSQMELFKACTTRAARLEYLLDVTTFLRWVPLGFVEKSAEVLDFFPSEK